MDPFNSTSKMLDPYYVKQEHFYVASNNDSILGFSQIVNGSLDIWSEGGFYLKGTICDITL